MTATGTAGEEAEQEGGEKGGVHRPSQRRAGVGGGPAGRAKKHHHARGTSAPARGRGNGGERRLSQTPARCLDGARRWTAAARSGGGTGHRPGPAAVVVGQRRRVGLQTVGGMPQPQGTRGPRWRESSPARWCVATETESCCRAGVCDALSTTKRGWEPAGLPLEGAEASLLCARPSLVPLPGGQFHWWVAYSPAGHAGLLILCVNYEDLQ